MTSPLLETRDLSVHYDKAVLLGGVSLSVGADELVGVVGPNGAGKSTLLRAVSGLIRWEKRHRRGAGTDIGLGGEVWFDGERIDPLPAHEIVRRGLVHCPERRRPFREMTVEDNLHAGAYLAESKAAVRNALERVYALFPALAERRGQVSGTLSGGEQQMLAVGRALMARPRLLLIDEPSLGLAPRLVAEVFRSIEAIHAEGIPLLVVEQDISQVFRVAARNYVLSQGRLIAEGTPQALLADEGLRSSYLGM